MTSNEIKQHIKILESLTNRKVLLKENSFFDVDKEVLKQLWMFVYNSLIDLIGTYYVQDTNAIMYFEKMFPQFKKTNKIKLEKEFLIPSSKIKINKKGIDDKSIQKKYIKLKLAVSNQNDEISKRALGVYLLKRKEITLYVTNFFYATDPRKGEYEFKKFIKLIRKGKRSQIKQILSVHFFSLLRHEFIHCMQAQLLNHKGYEGVEKGNTRYDMNKSYESSDVELEAYFEQVYSKIKRSIVKNKKRLSYKEFFEMYNYTLNVWKEERPERYKEAMSKLFDLLKTNYLYDDGYKIPSWIES